MIRLSHLWHMGDSRTVDQRLSYGICLSASVITFGSDAHLPGSSLQPDSLACLLDLREKRDPAVRREVRKASYSLSNVVTYLNSNVESLIDYRTWQCSGGRISTGFVESSINRIIGRRMCKGQQMRWSRVGAHSVVQLRVALLNREFHELAQRQFPCIGLQRVSWPWR